MRGMCVLDPNAENHIDKLKGNINNTDGAVQRRQTVAKTTGGNTTGASQLLGSSGAQTGHIYILERDTKFVYEYQLATKNIYKRTV